MPFDRMVSAVDRWAGEHGRSDVFAQIGPTDLRPSHIKWAHFLDPPRFREMVEDASVVVAHAGMGSILTALELGKPILVMPRRGDLHETRNDHQLATARALQAQGRVSVAFTEAHLLDKLDHLDSLHAARRISSDASPTLLGAIQAFVHGQNVVAGLRRSLAAALAQRDGRAVEGQVGDAIAPQESHLQNASV